MTVAVVLLAVVVFAVVVYMIARPFWQGEPADADDSSLLEDVAGSEDEREKVFAALSDVEYDYAMKKLSEDDYRELKGRLEKQAVAYLKEEENLAVESALGPNAHVLEDDLDREIEAEVAWELGGAASPASPGYCPSCGAKLLSPGQRFCHACGGKLS
ncbi:MAG: zinc ribbon domain-containing protein [Firmicutes bacterium]|nr:zinc ribbon domain-containing protein [Bacillota bacterium]